MHNAAKLKFETRRSGFSPIAVWSMAPGGQIPETKIADARSASLKKDAENVLIRSISAQPDGSYVGEIYGFDPSISTDYSGMKIGDRIQFDEAHVFGIND